METSPWRPFWLLDPEVVYLNHGSFGACPQPVLEVQQQLRQALERQPMAFLGRDYELRLDVARQQLATFLGGRSQNLVFVPNATTGVNTVLRSLNFRPGDQLLTTDHCYNACRNALNFVADRAGAEISVVTIPFPLQSPAQILTAVQERITPRTRLALFDHVTSQTGLIFPLQELIQSLSAQGIDTLIDGAHAAGMIPLNLEELGATYYAGNCHKWMCTPKGAGFLYVQPEKQATLRPLTISHGANSPRQDRSRFWLEFDWTGTDDPTAYLSVPAAIAWFEQLLPGGWSELMQRNRDLVLSARRSLCAVLNIPLPCPDQMIGTIASLPLPPGDSESLQAQLLHQFQIEVPVFPWPTPPHRLIRISAQIYNHFQDYERLGLALPKLLSQPG
uniref:Aminotransferase class V n=1 Tax=Cyanothece sp. (strain PCC 7425 / ATCC 29141) TaxID=395961 RepID=B8HVT0_CYAP4